MKLPLYPLLLQPGLHIKVWGGRRLATQMNKTLPDDAPYGESWEIHDSCIIANGALAGQSLADAIAAHGTQILGKQFDPAEGMPLLIKLIDAEQWLSVQVHPNDEQARALEADPRGKTEAWVMLATEAGAQIVIGVQPGTNRAAMAEAIRTGTLEDHLVYTLVEADDVLYIPANTIHAIGPGILLYEVQQSSDVTYRLYDWNRMGLDGKPRELHIEKGVQVSNVESLPEITRPQDGLLVESPYFQTWRHHLEAASAQELETNGSFHALTCIAGHIQINYASQTWQLEKGQSALIPAEISAYILAGDGVLLRSLIPE